MGIIIKNSNVWILFIKIFLSCIQILIFWADEDDGVMFMLDLIFKLMAEYK